MAKNHHILHLTIKTPDGVQVRRLNARDSLNIGYDPSNDVPVEGSGVPKKFTLVVGNRNYYLLWLQRDMQGEIVAGTARLKIQDLNLRINTMEHIYPIYFHILLIESI